MTHLPPQQPEFPPPPPGSGYQPPAGALPAHAYASWFARVGAYLIDSIPAMVIGGIGFGIAVATGNNVCVADTEGYGGACSSSFSGLGIVAILLASLAVLAYSIWNWGYRQGTTGSSIGKSALNFKVVSEATGQPIGTGTSILRQLVHVVDGAICYLGYLWPLFDAKRQTWTDKIMSTVCVPTR
jgi:uncharacterized RDD family membrane protein YckC